MWSGMPRSLFGTLPRRPAEIRAQACQAACDIDLAIERFNEAQGPLTLPTRIGLHFGPMILGNVGTVDHYEYRAVGDTPIAALASSA